MKTKLAMTAMILAGGKSSRMGQDKALLKFGGRTLLEHLTALMKPIFSETLVIVDEREKLKGLDLSNSKVYEDLPKGKGPLAGIYTGLLYSRNKMSCVFTCDMPFVDEPLIRQLTRFWEEDYDVVCLEGPQGNYQPFPGIYARSARYVMSFLLNRGEGSMKKFLEVTSVKPLILEEERIEVLTNMNTFQDYYRVLRQKNEQTFSS